ncbi:FeoB-associated Cys-rich membrane protein [Clostridium sp. 'deep sea']|nr:FeoB-associated Cys-rich membrane protein [Clostridium sp. 'deep sea']QOR35514.1 FeoB-associated Cys-rich membrane protein [Clostridium sp. 'deep sea']
MGTFIVGVILAGIIFYAAKRVWHDMKTPGCAGCSSCSMKDKCNSKQQ